MPHMFKGSENAHFYTTHAIPTLRKCGANMRIKESYNSYSYNFKKTVDGFLCTNNVQIECSYGFDNAFLYSDHQPVAIRFVLN
ncbi:MAG: hypothetical protein K2M43_01985 [Mycoplasmoidaceae bacterium]|nr:hypothetical protein [Mycoplasmoidaceae bacterium]